jgi:hypothetical protein
VCEECFTIRNILRKKYGDTLPIKNTWDKLPIQNIWRQIATNTKYMGTDCQYKYGDRLPIKIYGDRLPIKNIWGQIANKNTWGPFSNIVYKNIYTQKITTMHDMRTGVHSTLYN